MSASACFLLFPVATGGSAMNWRKIEKSNSGSISSLDSHTGVSISPVCRARSGVGCGSSGRDGDSWRIEGGCMSLLVVCGVVCRGAG